jgi:hypothetical protein
MRAHAHVEDRVGRLKDSGLLRFPFVDQDANRAWLAVVCFAADLVCWFQLLCLSGELAAANPKRLRWTLWTPQHASCGGQVDVSCASSMDGRPPISSSALTSASLSSPNRIHRASAAATA